MIDTISMLASSEINGTVIWIVIVVGIAIVNYLRQTFKKTGDESEEGDDDVSSPQARKVRQIIEEMKRGTQPPTRQPRPTYAEPMAHTPTVAPMVKHVSHQPRPSSAVHSGWEDSAAETAAKTAALQRVPDMTKSVERSMSTLSNAERKALEKLKSGALPPLKNDPISVARQPVGSFVAGLRTREALKMAVIYREILGEPKALKSRTDGVGF